MSNTHISTHFPLQIRPSVPFDRFVPQRIIDMFCHDNDQTTRLGSNFRLQKEYLHEY